MILIIILYALIASTFIMAQQAVQACSPLIFIAVRMISAGILLLMYEKLWHKKQIVPQKKDWLLFGIVTILHIYGAFTLEFWALQQVSALKANFLYALTPFIAFAIERVWVRKKESLIKLVGVCIGFCGLIPLLGIHAGTINFTITKYDIALLGSIISATSAWFFIRTLFAKNYSIVLINGWSMLWGGLLSLGTALVSEHIYVADICTFLWCLTGLVLISNIGIYTLYGMLITRYSITLITATGFLCPLFGLLYDWVLYGTIPNILYVPALICIASGLLLVYKYEK